MTHSHRFFLFPSLSDALFHERISDSVRAHRVTLFDIYAIGRGVVGRGPSGVLNIPKTTASPKTQALCHQSTVLAHAHHRSRQTTAWRSATRLREADLRSYWYMGGLDHRACSHATSTISVRRTASYAMTCGVTGHRIRHDMACVYLG